MAGLGVRLGAESESRFRARLCINTSVVWLSYDVLLEWRKTVEFDSAVAGGVGAG